MANKGLAALKALAARRKGAKEAPDAMADGGSEDEKNGPVFDRKPAGGGSDWFHAVRERGTGASNKSRTPVIKSPKHLDKLR